MVGQYYVAFVHLILKSDLIMTINIMKKIKLRKTLLGKNTQEQWEQEVK